MSDISKKHSAFIIMSEEVTDLLDYWRWRHCVSSRFWEPVNQWCRPYPTRTENSITLPWEYQDPSKFLLLQLL